MFVCVSHDQTSLLLCSIPPRLALSVGLSVCMIVMLDSYLLSLCSLLHSDYIIEEKNAVLQKKENEGFGFVLRGAKGEVQTHKHTHAHTLPKAHYTLFTMRVRHYAPAFNV